MDTQALDFARAYLQARDADVDPKRPFRARSGHIRRVCLWLERLLAQEDIAAAVPDMAALRLAAALHDTGYAHSWDEHARHGADVVMEYAQAHGTPKATAERAAFLVREHSDKDKWLGDPQTPVDIVLLMEADMLDEEGAMGIVVDCMSATLLGAQDYMDAYRQMQTYEPPRLAQNRMVTPLARSLWTEKQRIIREFMEAFAYDLGLES